MKPREIYHLLALLSFVGFSIFHVAQDKYALGMIAFLGALITASLLRNDLQHRNKLLPMAGLWPYIEQLKRETATRFGQCRVSKRSIRETAEDFGQCRYLVIVYERWHQAAPSCAAFGWSKAEGRCADGQAALRRLNAMILKKTGVIRDAEVEHFDTYGNGAMYAQLRLDINEAYSVIAHLFILKDPGPP